MGILDHLLSSRLVHPLQFDIELHADGQFTLVVCVQGDVAVNRAALHRRLVVFGSQADGALKASCSTYSSSYKTLSSLHTI